MDAPKICVSTSGYGESIRTRVLVRPAGRGDSFQAGLTLRLADGEGAEAAFELAARYDAFVAVSRGPDGGQIRSQDLG